MVTFALLRVLVVVLLVAANAFFVAAEYALVSIRETRIQQLIESRRIGARTGCVRSRTRPLSPE